MYNPALERARVMDEAKSASDLLKQRVDALSPYEKQALAYFTKTYGLKDEDYTNLLSQIEDPKTKESVLSNYDAIRMGTVKAPSRHEELRGKLNTAYDEHIKGTPVEGVAKTVLPAAALTASTAAAPIIATNVGGTGGAVVSGIVTGAADGVTLGQLAPGFLGTGNMKQDAVTGGVAGGFFPALAGAASWVRNGAKSVVDRVRAIVEA